MTFRDIARSARLVSSLRETTTTAPERSLVNIKTCSLALFLLGENEILFPRIPVAAFSISLQLSESIPLCPPHVSITSATRAREKRVDIVLER